MYFEVRLRNRVMKGFYIFREVIWTTLEIVSISVQQQSINSILVNHFEEAPIVGYQLPISLRKTWRNTVGILSPVFFFFFFSILHFTLIQISYLQTYK